MQMRAFDDDEEEKDVCAGPWKEGKDGEYEKSVCEAWKAHHEKVAAHKKKFGGIAQKHSLQGLMQMQAFDDEEEEKDACAGPWKEGKDGEYEKSVCEAWKAHHEKVAAHKKKFGGIAQKQAHGLMQMGAYDDEEVDKCLDFKDGTFEKRECEAWKAHHAKVKDHKAKYENLHKRFWRRDLPDANEKQFRI